MISKIKQAIALRMEYIIMRGPLAQLGLVAGILLSIALVAGLLMRLLDPTFETTGDALWWAFEHVLVPEFIDGDDNFARRAVGTVLIVICSMLFIGTVVAILVQWMNSVRERLEHGTTPITQTGHYVLLGWTSRTPLIARAVYASESPAGERQTLAILVERASATLIQELRSLFGRRWKDGQVILRSGSAISLDDLQRVNVARARTIVLPSSDTDAGSNLDADSRAAKSLISLDRNLERVESDSRPLVVVELQNLVRKQTLKSLYDGPLEMVAGADILAKIIVQTVRYPGLSHVYSKLLTDDGAMEHFTFQDAQLVGLSMAQVMQAIPNDIVLGLIQATDKQLRAVLNPPDDLTVQAGDQIVVLGKRPAEVRIGGIGNAARPSASKATENATASAHRRVLILGWNRHVPAVLREFGGFPEETYEVDIISVVPERQREQQVAEQGVANNRLKIRHLELDYTDPAQASSISPMDYDNVVFLPSERLRSGAEADARSILGYVMLRELMPADGPCPPILVELTDASNEPLFANRRGEILVATDIVSHLLAKVSLQRELRVVFENLFSSQGSEIRFRSIGDYDLEGKHNFLAVQEAARDRNEIAIGIRKAGHLVTPHGGVHLNPGRDTSLQLQANDDVVVIAGGTEPNG